MEESNNKEIDQLTLNLLMNRNKFKSGKNVSLQSEDDKMTFELNLESFKQEIETTFLDLLNDPNLKIHPDVKENFRNFCKATIHHFQQKTVESTNLFNVEEPEIKQVSSKPTIGSFWGNEIVKKIE